MDHPHGDVKPQIFVQSTGYVETAQKLEETRAMDARRYRAYLRYGGKVNRVRVRRFDPLFAKRKIDGSKRTLVNTFTGDCIPRVTDANEMYTFAGFSNTDHVQTTYVSEEFPVNVVHQGMVYPVNVGSTEFDAGDKVYVKIPHPNTKRSHAYKHDPSRQSDEVLPFFTDNRFTPEKMRELLAMNDGAFVEAMKLFLTMDAKAMMESAEYVCKLQENMLTEDQTIDDAYTLRVGKMANDDKLNDHLERLSNWMNAMQRRVDAIHGTPVGISVRATKPGERLKLYVK